MDTTHIEQAVIAALLSPTEAYKDIMPQLSADCFSSEIAKEAFCCIKSIADNGNTPTVITLFSEAKKGQKLSPADIIKIQGWCSEVTFNEPLPQYVAMLVDAKLSRQVDTVVNEHSFFAATSTSGIHKATELIKKLTDILDSVSTTSNIITTAELVKQEREHYYRRQELALLGKTTGLDTGLTALNRFTGGLQPEFIILAGRPSMGKTAFALHLACKFGSPGIYFNLEMGNSQLCQRLIIQHTNEINAAHLRDGTLTPPELHAFESTIGIVEKLPVLIYDKARCGVHEAARVIRQNFRKGLCQWVIIDYLQLMTIEGFRGGNRELEVAEISRTLKALQKELGIPIIALAQLSRQVEQRADKKPVLSDLRESGSLEQDADTVMFIYRPSQYGLSKDDGNEYTNEVFLLIEKHRQGGTGEVMFRANRFVTTFYDDGVDPVSSFRPVPMDEPISSKALEAVRDRLNTSDDNPFK